MDPAMREAEARLLMWLAFIGFVILVYGLIYRRNLIRQMAVRRAELAQLAESRGMEFHPGYTGGTSLLALLGIWVGERDPLAERLSEWLGFFGWHPKPVLSPVLFQSTPDMEWFVIDYANDHGRYSPKPTKEDSPLSKAITVENYSVVVVRLPMWLPAAQIFPSTKVYRARVAVNVPVFRTESNEFNDKFVVWTYEPAPMHEVLHPLAIAHVLSEPTIGWEMNGPYLMAFQPGRLTAEGYGEFIDRVQAFIDLIPAYLKEDHAFYPNDQAEDEYEEE